MAGNAEHIEPGMVTIRPERRDDYDGIRTINTEAFGRKAEAELVAALRDEGALLLSLVAEAGGQLVGHIAFSPARIVGEEAGDEIETVALGPMAVLPALQGQGIGSKLVGEGLKMVIEQGATHLFVLGYPSYYTRFGFEPAQRYGVRCQFDAPSEAFMVFLPGGTESGVQDLRRGVLYYHPAFSHV